MDEILNDSNLTAEQRRKLLTTWLQFDEYLKKLDQPEDPWGQEAMMDRYGQTWTGFGQTQKSNNG
jgi:hypothetical protein